jgi:hypothetical protein
MKTLLMVLLMLVAFSSTVAGLAMIANQHGDALNIPMGLFEGTPFRSFLLPGILLSVIVGGFSLFAIFLITQKSARQFNWSIVAGAVVILWVIAEMVLLQFANWLHAVYLVVGLLIILAAYQLKGKWAM